MTTQLEAGAGRSTDQNPRPSSLGKNTLHRERESNTNLLLNTPRACSAGQQTAGRRRGRTSYLQRWRWRRTPCHPGNSRGVRTETGCLPLLEILLRRDGKIVPDDARALEWTDGCRRWVRQHVRLAWEVSRGEAREGVAWDVEGERWGEERERGLKGMR